PPRRRSGRGTSSLCDASAAATSGLTGIRGSEGELCLYAMKVVDRWAVARKQKLERAAAKKRILRQLDHPFFLHPLRRLRRHDSLLLCRHGVLRRRRPPLSHPPHAIPPLPAPLRPLLRSRGAPRHQVPPHDRRHRRRAG
ncbi:Os11g0115301, partial [Oryza sativa Japonica Group]